MRCTVPAERHEHWLPAFFSKREFARNDAIRISRWLFPEKQKPENILMCHADKMVKWICGVPVKRVNVGHET